jgi:hypothetical protein
MVPPTPPPLIALPSPPGVNHGGGLLWLGGDRLLACWYSGRSEAGRDAVIACARSDDGGARWAGPQVVSQPRQRALLAGAPAKSVGNVVLARDASGRLVMFSGEVQSRRRLGIETCRSWRCGRIDFRLSADDGMTWSAPTRLDDRPGALPRSRPLSSPALGDLLPVYQERGSASVLRLDLATLRTGQRPAVEVMPITAPGPLIQPSLVQAPQTGRITAYLRDPRRRFVYRSDLDPATGRWSPARPTDLGNPGSAVEAFADGRGREVLVYNPGRKDRRTLSLAFSRGGGPLRRGCDLVAGQAGDVAYPSVSPMGPGRWGVLFSAYDKRRMVFMPLSQDDLDACAEGRRP